MRQARELSIVIPVAPGDFTWRVLITKIQGLPFVKEILISGAESEPVDFKLMRTNDTELRWLVGPRGRARQLNLGEQAASGDWIWFLHADSSIYPETLEALRDCLSRDSKVLFFFDLKFDNIRLPVVRLNEVGANFRSRYLKLPFGDQGFLIPKKVFSTIGPFNEAAPCGEDHLLVWSAHQHGIAVRSLRAPLGTSPRKYESQGWARTTLKHIGITVRQSLPELAKLIRSRSHV